MTNRTLCGRRKFRKVRGWRWTAPAAYLELIGLVDNVEIGLDSKNFFQTLLEQTLESHILLDVAKEGIDDGRKQGRLLLQRLKQAVQMLNYTACNDCPSLYVSVSNKTVI